MATNREELQLHMRRVSNSMLTLGNTLLDTRLIPVRALLRQEKYPEAIEVLEVLLDEFMSRYGTEHPLVWKLWLELGEIYQLNGDDAEVERCLMAASQIMRSVSGEQ
jgi:hypothetical protein